MTTTHPATTSQIPQSTKGTNQTLTTNTTTERTAQKLKFLVNILEGPSRKLNKSNYSIKRTLAKS